MYLDYFKLNELPFKLTPNTHYFLELPTYSEALNVLLVGLGSGEGFIKIIGEVGTGKTLLCRKLLNKISSKYKTAYIFNPIFSPTGLYRAVADELDIEIPDTFEQHNIINLITLKLIAYHRQGKQVVLLIDEAQAMSEEVLEALRLMTNLETESDKLLQVVLFGQPELDKLLQKPRLRQTKQRITFSYYLQCIKREELATYIHHRLYVAGYRGALLFSNAALDLLQHASRGVPRLINTLSHKSLMVAFGRGEIGVRRLDVFRAILDTEDVSVNHGSLRYKLTARFLSLTSVLALVSVNIANLFYGF